MLVDEGEMYRLAQDYAFETRPSTAAGVLLGRSANGRAEWKDAKGRSLKEASGAGVSRRGMTAFTESVVEDAALAWLEALGYTVLQRPDDRGGEPAAERTRPALPRRGAGRPVAASPRSAEPSTFLPKRWTMHSAS